MPEGAHAYPRWDGPMRLGGAFAVIAAQEIRRAFHNTWSQLAILGTLAFGVVWIGDVADAPDSFHTTENFVEFLNQLRWASLAIAAAVAGPAFLEDARRGALDLYFSRAVGRADYLVGKILGVMGLTTLGMFVPGLAYWVSAYFFFDKQPKDWALVPMGILAYAILWGALVSGLGLGLSCVAKSSRGAILILFGGFAILEIFVTKLLDPITRNTDLQILSPFSAMAQLNEWLFGIEPPHEFETWWALIEWLVLVGLGWGLVAWKYPRVRGDERGGR